MRYRKKLTTSDGGGSYQLTPEDAEDMWIVYNLIAAGDRVRASALRKVVRESASGATSSDKVRTWLTIQVLETSFDPESGTVRVAGKNAEENSFVRLGAHHTLLLEPHRDVEIEKELWDSVQLKTLEEAADVSKKAEIAAVVMDGGAGIASVCLLTERMTVVRGKVEMSVPKKRAAASSSSAGPGASGGGQHEKGMNRFFEAVLQALLRSVDLATVKAVVIASPGFTKDDFFKWMMEEASRRGGELKALTEAKGKFLLAHSSSGHSRSLQSVFLDPAVAARLSDTRAAAEVNALASFFRTLNKDHEAADSSGGEGGKAFYGYRHTRLAADRGAVETLLLSDALFRCPDPPTRRDYLILADDVTAAGGTVRVFSSLHASGEQLSQLSGVACLCRFPLWDADDASACYQSRATAHAKAIAGGLIHSGSSSAAGGGASAGGGAGGEGGDSHHHHGGGGGAAPSYNSALYDSDDSSDSDASYKKGR